MGSSILRKAFQQWDDIEHGKIQRTDRTILDIWYGIMNRYMTVFHFTSHTSHSVAIPCDAYYVRPCVSSLYDMCGLFGKGVKG